MLNFYEHLTKMYAYSGAYSNGEVQSGVLGGQRLSERIIEELSTEF